MKRFTCKPVVEKKRNNVAVVGILSLSTRMLALCVLRDEREEIPVALCVSADVMRCDGGLVQLSSRNKRGRKKKL